MAKEAPEVKPEGEKKGDCDGAKTEKTAGQHSCQHAVGGKILLIRGTGAVIR